MPQTCDGLRVLIVEDEALIGLTIADGLKEEGYRIVGPAESRKEALTLLEQARPHIAILDLSLRDGFCIGLARELRACNIPFMVFSGLPRQQVVSDVLGAAPWVAKPCRIEEITGALGKLADTINSP